MSANLRHLRAPALASWIAEALAESAAEEEHSAVSLIPSQRDDDGSEPVLYCLRSLRRETRSLELTELSVELEGHEPGEPWSFFGPRAH